MATLTANPATGANTPCDGPVNRVGRDETFATIISSAGNQGGLESTGTDNFVAIKASTTTNQFAECRRGFFSFDTSSIGSTSTITAAVFSVVCNFKTNGLGNDSYDLVTASPAATNALPASTFALCGSTSLANVTYASINSGGSTYTDWTISDYTVINKTGVTSLCLRSAWDRSGTFGGTWASGAETRFQGTYADAGSNKPKLVVTYTTGGGTVVTTTFLMMGVG